MKFILYLGSHSRGFFWYICLIANTKNLMKYLLLLSIFLSLCNFDSYSQTDKTVIVYKDSEAFQGGLTKHFKFINDSVGLIIDRQLPNRGFIRIHSTKNGGSTWNLAILDSTSCIDDIIWVDPDTVFLFGRSISYGCSTPSGTSSAATFLRPMMAASHGIKN
ncbi:MAG: hypothetical protein ACI9XP_001077 [Lentimonas sp.]|jgi:hypothetical protein